eukprot:CAMPEP_0117680670 /NCGR_PEP_ID=MMETSP0804-20121206/18495_1 /TAXON_ID=1074897 /ORGANISM="Tetraselmis astigmatica, Strain CCMP880" /LENGTH=167 /DNA_ID=CAMNT_0005490221 /DNA_START=125 /DNA_END=625 /DNA_ORIENTATION=+
MTSCCAFACAGRALFLSVLLLAHLVGGQQEHDLAVGIHPVRAVRHGLCQRAAPLLHTTPVSRTLLERAPDEVGEFHRHLSKARRASDDELELPSEMEWAEYKEFLELKEADMGSVQAELPEDWNWDAYHNTMGIKQLLELLGDNYGDIASPFPIGESVRGREIWGIK